MYIYIHDNKISSNSQIKNHILKFVLLDILLLLLPLFVLQK